MRLPRVVGFGFALRALVKELRVLREQQTEQNRLLARLADHFAPVPPTLTAESLRDTGVNYLDQIEAGMVEEYVAQTRNDLGREPTSDEILAYLADEKTTDLHQRLIERQQDIDRLMERRR